MKNLMLPSVKEAISNVITDTYERFGYTVGQEINGDRYDMVYDVINRKITRHLNAISNKFKLDYTIMPGVSLPDVVIKYDLTESFLGSEEFTEIMVGYYNRYTAKINANYKETTEGGMSMQGGEERLKKVSPTQADYEKYLLNNNTPSLKVHYRPSVGDTGNQDLSTESDVTKNEISNINENIVGINNRLEEFANALKALAEKGYFIRRKN